MTIARPRISVAPGHAASLGARVHGDATNFALFSAHAEAVELCLFDDDGDETRIPISDTDNDIWHVRVEGVGAGQRYGYRVHGPWDPARGYWFNSAKLLIDPYARVISGAIDWSGPVYGFESNCSSWDLRPDRRDDAAFKPRGLVVEDAFDWEDDRAPRTSWMNTVIYETHVKGMTCQHPDLPAAIRGTFAGLAHPLIIDHLHRLGITAIELLPVHAFVDEANLANRGLKNYWGYNTLGFFAPEGRYSDLGDQGGQVRAFKEMVKALHRAGIEVLLDVVYNHTAEGDDSGPLLSFRGIDNLSYYHLSPDHPRRSLNWTGTGNTVKVSNLDVLRLVMDSLRYWVEEMHVDGFRFDLGCALARDEHHFSDRSVFFAAVRQDPVLAKVKLIAEPWDLGERGYRLGSFPRGWSEWNDRYRDSVRGFWLGGHHRLTDLGFRLSGSADLFKDARRRPSSSINFVTAHDGFTLRDLVSFQGKCNHANGEDNRDGSDHNISNNHGIEGLIADPEIEATRKQQRKNLLATLMLSLGVPMMLGGDELGRSQMGNNNAFAQDNHVSWFDWSLDEQGVYFLNFVRRLSELRRELAPLKRLEHPTGSHLEGTVGPDLTWFRFDGHEMQWNDWIDPASPALGFRLFGAHTDGLEQEGPRLLGCFVALNASSTDASITLPPKPDGIDSAWTLALSTAEAIPPSETVPARSVSVFTLRSIGGQHQSTTFDSLIRQWDL